MFSKSKDSVSPPPSSVTVAPVAAPKRTPRGTVPSIISGDLTVTGTLISNGDIQIDGFIEGDVRSVGLVIGEKAEIRGEVLAEDITVRGKVIGRIRARKVQLSATSHVEGDILHEAFSVEAGAFFEGNCRHSDNPLGDEAHKAAPQTPQTNVQPQPSLATPRVGLTGLTPIISPAE